MDVKEEIQSRPLEAEATPIGGEVEALPPNTGGNLAELKQTETVKFVRNLEGAKGNSLNMLNMVLAGLIVSIPSYMGLGWLLDHINFVSEGTKTMARLGAMMGIRPVLNSLTNIVKGKVFNPVTSALANGIEKGQNSKLAKRFQDTIRDVPSIGLTAQSMPA